MSDLRPCPFCGGTEERPEWIQHKDGCFMWMQATGKKGGIIEAWQTRASDAQAEKLAGLLRYIYSTHTKPGSDADRRIADALAAYDAGRK